MKKLTITALLACAFALCFALAGCGGGGGQPADAPDEGAVESAVEGAEGAAAGAVGSIDLSGVNFSAVDVTIAYGDYAGMETLAKDIQNGNATDKIVTIDGVCMHPGTSYSIGEPNEDGSKKIGTQFLIVGADPSIYPADEAHIGLTGVVTKIDPDHGVFGIATLPELVQIIETEAPAK